MNTVQLLNDLSMMFCTKNKNFIVAPADSLPKKTIKRPFYAIANTSKKSQPPGQHWIAFVFPKNNQNIGYFFDSYGLAPINKYHYDFLSRNCKKIIFNSTQFQSNTSNVCGLYCLAFIDNLCRGKSYSSFLQQFDRDNLEKNDFNIEKMYRKMKNRKKKNTTYQFGRGKKNVCKQICTSRIRYQK